MSPMLLKIKLLYIHDQLIIALITSYIHAPIILLYFVLLRHYNISDALSNLFTTFFMSVKYLNQFVGD